MYLLLRVSVYWVLCYLCPDRRVDALYAFTSQSTGSVIDGSVLKNRRRGERDRFNFHHGESTIVYIYMGGAWGTYGRQERYIRCFGEET